MTIMTYDYYDPKKFCMKHDHFSKIPPGLWLHYLRRTAEGACFVHLGAEKHFAKDHLLFAAPTFV